MFRAKKKLAAGFGGDQAPGEKKPGNTSPNRSERSTDQSGLRQRVQTTDRMGVLKVNPSGIRSVRKHERPENKAYFKPEAYYQQIQSYIPKMVKKTLDIYHEYRFASRRLLYLLAKGTRTDANKAEIADLSNNVVKKWVEMLQGYVDFLHDHLGYLIKFPKYHIPMPSEDKDEEYEDMDVPSDVQDMYKRLVYLLNDVYGEKQDLIYLSGTRDALSLLDEDTAALRDEYKPVIQQVIIKDLFEEKPYGDTAERKPVFKTVSLADKINEIKDSNPTVRYVLNRARTDLSSIAKAKGLSEVPVFGSLEELKAYLLSTVKFSEQESAIFLAKVIDTYHLHKSVEEIGEINQYPNVVQEIIKDYTYFYGQMIGAYHSYKNTPETVSRAQGIFKPIFEKKVPEMRKALNKAGFGLDSFLYKKISLLGKEAENLYDRIERLKLRKESNVKQGNLQPITKSTILFKTVNKEFLPLELSKDDLKKLDDKKAILLMGNITENADKETIKKLKKVYTFDKMVEKIELLTEYFKKEDTMFENLSIDLFLVAGGISNIYELLRARYNRRPVKPPIQFAPFINVKNLPGVQVAPFLIVSYDIGGG